MYVICVYVIVSVDMCRNWRLMSFLSFPLPTYLLNRVPAKVGTQYFGWTSSGEAQGSSCFCLPSSSMMCAGYTCYFKWILEIQTHVFMFTLQALDWPSQLPSPSTHVYRIDHLMPRENVEQMCTNSLINVFWKLFFKNFLWHFVHDFRHIYNTTIFQSPFL